LPEEYNASYQIYKMAKTLGQPEKFIEDTYTYLQIFERNLFEQHDSYIFREMNKE
jgi:hypothetical protein